MPSRPLRVLRIIDRLNVGGPAKHVSWLTAELNDAGFESRLVTGTVPDGEGDMGYFAEALGVRPLVIPELSRAIAPRDLLVTLKLFLLLLRWRPDIIHTHKAKAGATGRVAAWLYRWATPSLLLLRPRNCRVVHTFHGHIFHGYYGPAQTRMFLTIERWLARTTDRIVTVSLQQRDELAGRYRIGQPSQYQVIPLGLELPCDTSPAPQAVPLLRKERGGEVGDRSRDSTSPAPPYKGGDSERCPDKGGEAQGNVPPYKGGGLRGEGEVGNVLKRELKIPDRVPLVGFVGRLCEVKNLPLLLAVARRLREADVPAQFVLIGDGHLRPTLEAMVEEYRLQSTVHFLGFREDVIRLYRNLDVTLLTSVNEGTPLTLIEAMAAGLPVASTEVGGVQDLMGRRQGHVKGFSVWDHGITAPTQDAPALADGLQYLLEQPALRQAMGERGQQFVKSHHSKQRLIEDIKFLYKQLMMN